MKDKEQAAQEVLAAVRSLLAAESDVASAAAGRLRLYGEAPAFDSAHKLTVSAASAIGAFALSVEAWWAMATGRRQSIGIDWMQAACSLNPGHFQKQSGKALPALSLLTELKADFYRTRDDRWFFPIGSYPHLRDGVLELLNCANTPAALADAVGRWSADELEDAFAQHKLPGVYARSSTEWLAHDQGAWLKTVPVIQIEKIGESEPEPARVQSRPLDQLRVLDLGHVIAGPVIARSLAEHGADVLRLDPPMKQDPFRQTIDTNIGKRSAFIDLNDPVDLQRIRQLMSSADVVVQSWRHGSMDRRGLGPNHAAELRPGMVYVSVSAYGDQGSWAQRGGFEQLGQVVSGVAVAEGSAEQPRLVPTYLLNDYLTGYLGAAGAMLALIRRAREGGSYHVKVSLTRTSMWVRSLGLQARDPSVVGQHFAQSLTPLLERRMSPFGVLEQFPPVAQFSVTPPYWALPPSPTGASIPDWLR